MGWKKYTSAEPKDILMALGAWFVISAIFDYTKVPLLGKLDLINDDTF